jgi:mannose-1-phosphate guanylyltransferase/mannose-6-phosphate isomerase
LIIAGGRGTRFWPASREARPKPLFAPDGKTSLLAATIARLQPLIRRERIFVLVAASHEKPFRKEITGKIPAGNLIVEPMGRNTAVAIAYGAAVIRRRLGDGLIAVMPADHLIEPASGFRATIASAIKLASAHESIVVIGVPPTQPEPGYGYQQVGAPVGEGFKVARFIEKPALARARRMVASGKYLWNAGMFVMSTRTLARELLAHAPALEATATRLASASLDVLAREYRKLKFDSFDRVVVEKSRRVLGVRARFKWHDVGSWHSLITAIGDKSGSVARGEVIALEAERFLAHSDSRLMVLFGVSDIVAVDTGDAILIAHREQSPRLGRVIEELERRGLHRYL